MNHANSQTATAKSTFFWTRIFPWLFLIIGIVQVIIGCRQAMHSYASVNWPTTDGKIIFSEVVKHDSTNSIIYRADIRYDYTVNGRSYAGHCVAYGEDGSTDSQHERQLVSKYQPEKVVVVFYKPTDPEVSLLEPGLTWRNSFLLLLGAFFALLAVLSLIYLPRVMKREIV
jgi:hypothetical protein